MNTEKLEEGGVGVRRFPERAKQEVLPAAPMRATHASRGWPWMATPGLRGAGTAQPNGFTAVRKTPDPYPAFVHENSNRS